MQVQSTNQRTTTTIIIGIEDEKKQRSLLGYVTNIFSRLPKLVQYRELIRNLVVRDLKVRYKNSALGILWSLLHPLMMMMVFTVVFTIMAPIRSASLQNFPVFVLCALLPWEFFSASVMGATSSIVGSAGLIKKVYFPREILPLSVVLANLVNFMISLIVLFGIMLIFQIPVTIWILYLPLVILIQVVFTVGMGLFLATVNVFYRDVQHILSVALLAWFFVTPIFYPLDILPRSYDLLGVTLDVWRLAYILNPMASLIATYRVILLTGASPALDFLLRTAMTAGVIFLIGWYVFHRYSWRFAEEL